MDDCTFEEALILRLKDIFLVCYDRMAYFEYILGIVS
jgi:hypothetical protein